MLKSYLSIFLPFTLVIGLCFQPKTAHADCVSDAASCVVNATKAQYYAATAVGEVLEFTALHPQCVSAIAAQDYFSITTMTAIGGLAATGQISGSYGGCKNDLYGSKAQLIIGPISSVLGGGNATLKQIAEGSMTQGIESAMYAIPFPGTLPTVGLQVDCGCAVASAGTGAVDKIKKAINATGAAAKTCSQFIGCLAGPVIGVITDVGKGFVDAGKYMASCTNVETGVSFNDCGESPPEVDDAIYRRDWEPFVGTFVQHKIDNKPFYVSGTLVDNGAWGLKLIWESCNAYYEDHRFAEEHADRICNQFRDNRFIPQITQLFNARIDAEIFPKATFDIAKTAPAKYRKVCALPSASKLPAGGVAVTDGGASTYGGAAAEASAACYKAIDAKIGLTAGGIIVADGTVVGEAKKNYLQYPIGGNGQANTYDFKKAFDLALAQYDTDLKAIAQQYSQKIAAETKQNASTVQINNAYRDITLNQKWAEYKAKCPASGAFAYSECIQKTAEFLGVQVGYNKDANGNTIALADTAALEFSQWKTQPIIYERSLNTYKEAAAAGAVSDDTAKKLVLLVYNGNLKAALDNIAPQAIKDAQFKLADVRQKQELAYANALDKFTADYTKAIKAEPKACKNMTSKDMIESSCKFKESTLTALFNIWNVDYKTISDEKAALDAATKPQMPYVVSSDVVLGLAPYDRLLLKVANLAAANKVEYQQEADKLDAVEKTLKNKAVVNPDARNTGASINKVKGLSKDKSAESLADKTGLKTQESTLDLKGQAKVAGLGDGLGERLGNGMAKSAGAAPPDAARPTIRGMRAAPGMVAVAPASNQVPPSPAAQNRPPAAVASVDDTLQVMKARAESQPLKDNKPSANGFDASKNIGSKPMLTQDSAGQSPVGQNPAAQEMPKPVDVANNNNLGNLRDVASKPAGNIGASVAASAASQAGQGNSRQSSVAPTANNVPPPVKAISNNAPLAPAAKAPEPPFDRNLYRHVTQQKLAAKWLSLCKNESCKTDISTLIGKRIDEILRLLDTGTDLRVKANLDAAEAKMDNQYNPQIQAKVDASNKIIRNDPVVPVEPVKPMSNKPIKKLSL